ncbi:S8 family serine peptidase [Paenarthrobacter nitroguajacolicus]|uniref:S8 family serine peptidase n=1 Tax=Paenarthrobacter nitroguajacolicus TaxID=211146 RepID=UPI004053FB60
MVNNSRLRPLRYIGLAVSTLLISGGLAVQPAAAADRIDIVPSSPQALTPTPETPTDQFIVGIRDNVAQAAAVKAENAADQAATKLGVSAKSSRQNATGGHVIKLDEALTPSEAEVFVETLRADPAVAYAEPDVIMHPTAHSKDYGYTEQWNLWDNFSGARTPGAWDYNQGQGVVVAVVDTGITNHPELNENVLPGYDMISSAADARDGDGRDPNPADQGDWVPEQECEAGSPAEDSSWHGTHVAGIVAAVGNNSIGISGVAPKAKILPVRALGVCGGYSSDIADSIVWAAGGVVTDVPVNPNPAKVINVSLGGVATCSATYQNAINFAYNAGAAVVVSAGNSNRPAVDVSPGNCQNVITVAASNKSGARAPYSNYGTAIDVTAPGGDMTSDVNGGILSTLNYGTTTPDEPAFAFMQGTSMAAPHVAGVAALLVAAEGNALTPQLLEQQLKESARPLPAGCSAGCGAGLVDATVALKKFGGAAPLPAPYKKLTDFNGDGTSDVIARDNSGVLWLYKGNGYGDWRGRTQIGVGWNVMTSVEAPGDFNGDGYADVMARDSAGVLWLYPGNGWGGFLDARKIGFGWNGMTSIKAPGDFNGDAKADVIARDGNGVLWLYPGNGSGGWLQARQIGVGWNVMTAIDGVGDFNGDGTSDVIARNGSGALWLYPGNGSGGWLAASQIGSGWNMFNVIEAPGDFDGDGYADVLGRTSGGDLVLYTGNGHSWWLYSVQVGSGWNSMNAIL